MTCSYHVIDYVGCPGQGIILLVGVQANMFGAPVSFCLEYFK